MHARRRPFSPQALWGARWTVTLIVAITMVIFIGPYSGAARGQCSCPWVGDVNGDGTVNVLDLLEIMNVISGGLTALQDPGCPVPRADITADGFLDIRDITAFLDEIFRGQATIVDPCDCVTQPDLCDPVFDPTPGEPGNSVVVESRGVIAGATDVRIPIYITNDIGLQAITLPLVVREITPGAFITAALPSLGERLRPDSNFFDRINQYADADGLCPGGFGTITHMDIDATGTKHAVGASPEGFLYIATRLLNGNFPPGSDVIGSMALTVDVGMTLGQFEIDTACIDPDNHLVFIEETAGTSTPIVPSFTKGIITIAENQPPVALCQDVTVSTGPDCGPVDALIDNGSYDPDGGDVILTQDPSGPYPLGSTLVTLTVEDDYAATTQCQATVTVEDTTPPEIICSDDIHLNIAPVYQGWVVAFDVFATDNCPGDVTITTSQESGTFFPNGTTEVFCTATDAAGNVSECSFLVTIVAECYDRLGDVNCDGVTDAMDINMLINATFFNGSIPPCTSPPGTEPPE